MLRSAVRAFAAFKLPNGGALSAGTGSSIRALGRQTRKYSTPPADSVTAAKERTSSSDLADSPHTFLATPLPATPEASTAPLVQSDFSEYLHPLYSYGWEFRTRFNSKREKLLPLLQRYFSFTSTKELAAFIGNMQYPGESIQVLIYPGLLTKIELFPSEQHVTRSTIRRVIEIEIEYQKMCPGILAPFKADGMRQPRQIDSLEDALALAFQRATEPPRNPIGEPVDVQWEPIVPVLKHLPPDVQWEPTVPVALPPPPFGTPSPPPPISEADLETYVKPLVLNGWNVGGINRSARFKMGKDTRRFLAGRPSLTRLYRFHDYASALDFLPVVVAAIPPTSDRAGVQISLLSDGSMQVWSFSRLQHIPGQKKYGISHADVRFAIEVETEFTKNWAGKADNVATLPRVVPTTMEHVWNWPDSKAPTSA